MTGNIIIKNAAQVVTCSGFTAKKGKEMADIAAIEDGAIIIEDGTIKAVGNTENVLKNIDTQGVEVIDATGKAVLPGFVDAHTHFVLFNDGLWGDHGGG